MIDAGVNIKNLTGVSSTRVSRLNIIRIIILNIVVIKSSECHICGHSYII